MRDELLCLERQCGLRRLLLAAALGVLAPAAGADEAIRTAVAERVSQTARGAHPDAEVTVTVAPLDPRLKLAACSNLEVEIRGPRRHGRVPVAVSCRAPRPWSVFMNADVTVRREVVVTRNALPRGQVLEPTHLTTELRDIGKLRQLYLTGVEEALGKALKRPLKSGSVVYPTLLRTPLAVKRGERVSIVSRHGSVRIAAPGESLESGEVGEQIRVRNERSGKTVHAWVVRPGVVATRRPEGATPAERQLANLD